jgi:hypothetical protein
MLPFRSGKKGTPRSEARDRVVAVVCRSWLVGTSSKHWDSGTQGFDNDSAAFVITSTVWRGGTDVGL